MIANTWVEFKFAGYLIPKGWKVMPLFRNIHHNPEIFPEPEKFNPSRFEVNNFIKISPRKVYIYI